MLEQSGYDVVKDDRKIRHGDWISAFMKSIGRGGQILVILSRKYLHSPYCMTELNHIYENSLRDKEEFLNRIIPVVVEKTLRFDDWRFVKDVVDHWESEFTDMEPHLSKLGLPQIERYQLIRQWCGATGNILGFIGDKFHPRGFDEIMKDDFAAVRQMLPPV